MRPLNWILLLLLAWGTATSLSQANPQQQASREQRTRRLTRVVPMKQVDITSPNGDVKFSLLPNAERLTFMVSMGGTIVLDPSPIVVKVDGYDLSSGVVLDTIETYDIDETYPWLGPHSLATNNAGA